MAEPMNLMEGGDLMRYFGALAAHRSGAMQRRTQELRDRRIREGRAGRLTPEERSEFFANAGVDPSPLGTPIANPLQDRLRGDLTGLSPEEQAAGRLIQSTQGHNPPRPVMPVPAPGPGEAGFGEGYYQGQSGVTVPGVGRRASNQVLGAGPVGAGFRSTGMNTGGAFGSSLMMGRAPELRVQERRAPAGGYLDFSEWRRQKQLENSPPPLAGMPLGRNVTTRGPDGSLTIENVPIVGGSPVLPHGLGVPAAYAGRGVPKPPVTPVAPVPGRQLVNPNLMGGVRGTFVRDATGQLVPAMRNAAGQWVPAGSAPPPAATKPVAPSAAGSWTDPVQPRFPPGRGGGPVYNPATATSGQAAAGTVAPAEAQAAAQAAGGPAPSPGFLRMAVPVGLGAGGGAVAVSMLAGGGQVQQVQMEDGTVVTIPVGETYEDKVARRRGLVAERGIQKGEARALRMGKAGPELRSRAYMAQSPEATAAIMAARERAMGEASANVPVAQAMMQQAQLQGLSAVLADPNATPEAKAQAQEQIANMPPIVAPYGGGIDPQQRYMGIPDYRGAAPVRPVTPPATAPSVQRPPVRDIDPTLSPNEIRAQSRARAKEEEQAEKWDRIEAEVQAGRVPFDLVPELGIIVSPYSGVSAEDAARHIVSRWPSIPYEEALRQVKEQRKPEPIRPFGANFQMYR